MAFDIYTDGTSYVADGRGEISASDPPPRKHMWVFEDEFWFVQERVQTSDEFPFLKKVFEDEYGEDGQIYMNELEQVANEIRKFKQQFETDAPQSVKDVINQLLELVEFAIKNRLTIIYVPD